MPNIAKMLVEYSGWDGGPGVNVLHFSQGTTTWNPNVIEGLVGDLEATYLGLRDIVSNVVSMRVLTTASIIDVASGEIIDVIDGGAGGGPIVGTGTGSSLSRATQCCVTTKTGKFISGRQLQGRVFVGPIASESLTTLGDIAPAVDTAVQDAFTAITTGLGTRLAVYRRPTKNPDTGAVISPGDYGDVSSVRTMMKPAVLRSRRD